MQPENEWDKKLDAEAERLGQTLARALEADPQTIGSPVYKEMVGLKPVDWSGVKTARADYFGEVFADWRARVEVAKLNGWPGDILTLADDAPTRFHRIQLLWQAADSLCSMHRFEAALPVLVDLLLLDRGHRKALTQLGLVLGRLGRINEAKVHMLQVAEQLKGDSEAQGVLGRVYKDLWRLEWKDLPTLQERQSQAVATSTYIASAVRSYDQAARRQFDYYNAINVVSSIKLLEHLKAATGDEPVDCNIDNVETLAAVVRFAAQNALDGAGLDAGQDPVWAAATLGELELVMGNATKARTQYRAAANAPEATYFNVNSMLDQVNLFQNLGFQPDGVAAVKTVLEQRRGLLESRIGGLKKSAPRFAKVLIATGHMIDEPDRKAERFPPRKEGIVREQIAARLKEWQVAAGDLAICGGRARHRHAVRRVGCRDRRRGVADAAASGERVPGQIRTPAGQQLGSTLLRSAQSPGSKDVSAVGSSQGSASGYFSLRAQQPVDGQYGTGRGQRSEEPLRAARLGRAAHGRWAWRNGRLRRTHEEPRREHCDHQSDETLGAVTHGGYRWGRKRSKPWHLQNAGSILRAGGNHMRRREFLVSAAAVAGLAGTTRVWAAQSGNAKLARLAVSSRNFGTIVKMGAGAPGPALRTLDVLDLPQFVADKFGVHNLELQHAHFMSTEAAYLKDLRDRVARAKSQIVQISTEFFATTASSTGPTRTQGIDLAKMWIDHAEALACPRVMVSAGPLGENVRESATATLKTIAEYAKAHKVTISIENMDTGVAPAPPAAPAPPPPPPPGAGSRSRGCGRGGAGGGPTRGRRWRTGWWAGATGDLAGHCRRRQSQRCVRHTQPRRFPERGRARGRSENALPAVERQQPRVHESRQDRSAGGDQDCPGHRIQGPLYHRDRRQWRSLGSHEGCARRAAQADLMTRGEVPV